MIPLPRVVPFFVFCFFCFRCPIPFSFACALVLSMASEFDPESILSLSHPGPIHIPWNSWVFPVIQSEVPRPFIGRDFVGCAKVRDQRPREWLYHTEEKRSRHGEGFRQELALMKTATATEPVPEEEKKKKKKSEFQEELDAKIKEWAHTVETNREQKKKKDESITSEIEAAIKDYHIERAPGGPSDGVELSPMARAYVALYKMQPAQVKSQLQPGQEKIAEHIINRAFFEPVLFEEQGKDDDKLPYREWSHCHHGLPKRHGSTTAIAMAAAAILLADKKKVVVIVRWSQRTANATKDVVLSFLVGSGVDTSRLTTLPSNVRKAHTYPPNSVVIVDDTGGGYGIMMPEEELIITSFSIIPALETPGSRVVHILKHVE